MLQKEDIKQIRKAVREEVSLAIQINNKHLVTKDDLVENNQNLVTKADLIKNNENLVTKADLIKNNENLVTKADLADAFIENNKNLVTKVEFNDLISMLKKSFDQVEGRFQDLEYQISLRPTLDKIMDWSDKRIHSLEMSMQSAQYILRDKWKDLPTQRQVHKTLVNDRIIG